MSTLTPIEPDLDTSIQLSPTSSPSSIHRRNESSVNDATGMNGVDFSSLLNTSATRKSLQLGRDLSPEELGALEQELEREIAQQMLEDELEGEEGGDDLLVDELEQQMQPNQPIVHMESILSSIEPIPENDASNNSTMVLSPAPTPSGKSKGRKSFVERAAAITPLTARRLSGSMLAASPVAPTSAGAHARSQSSSVVAELLLQSPNTEALRLCMQKANGATSSPRLVPTQPNFGSPIQAALSPRSSSTMPLSSASKIPILRSRHASADMTPPGCTESRSALWNRVQEQESQILQAGMLGQQLIEEMESLECKWMHERKEKDSMMDSLQIELDRSNKKLVATERQASEWKLQVQSGLDAVALLSEELVRAQTKATIFEAAQKKAVKEFEREVEELKKGSIQGEKEKREMKELSDKLSHCESKLTSLQSTLKKTQEDLTCAQLDLAAQVKTNLSQERNMKEKDREIEKGKKDLVELQSNSSNAQTRADETISRLSSALEEATGELEKTQFQLREERERVSGLEKQVKELKSNQQHHIRAISTADANPSMLSPRSFSLLSPRSKEKGRNARLTSLGYDSLLNELQTELHSQGDASSDQEDKENGASAPTVQQPVAPIPKAVEAFMTPKPALRVHTASSSDSSDDDEGDSPSHRRTESISEFLRGATPSAKVAVPQSNQQQGSDLLKRPSSVTKLGNWLSNKVSEAESSLRMLTQSTEDETDRKKQQQAQRERQLLPVSRPRAASTPTGAARIQPPQTPVASVLSTPTPSATIPMIAATPISRAITEAVPSGAPAAVAPTKDARVDVLREYFHLATLAVKLSSTDENLRSSNYSVHSLYSEVIALDVPFAHWHQWIADRLVEISQQADSHELLRPRTMPQATPGKIPTTTLLPIPKTPVAATNGRPIASPIMMRPFDTPQSQKTVSHTTPRTSAGTQSVVSTPRALGENTLLVNTTSTIAQTPASKPSTIPGSVQPRVLATPAPSSVHRPAVRGAERFTQRQQVGSMTPSGAILATPQMKMQPAVGGSTIHRPVSLNPNQPNAPKPTVATVPPPSTSLFSKLSLFVTAAPAPQPTPRR